jgi:hypothetical protein
LSCREADAYATKSQTLKMALLRGCLVTSQRCPCPDLEFWTLPSLKKIYAVVISQYMECPLVQDSLNASLKMQSFAVLIFLLCSCIYLSCIVFLLYI